MKTESTAEKITREANAITRALRRNGYIVRKRNGYGAWNIFTSKSSQHCFLLSWRNTWELHPSDQTDDYNTIRNLINEALQISNDQQSLL